MEDAAEFFCVARELAIRRAVRDAHRAECGLHALECSVCRVHAERIADAKLALQRDRLEYVE